jgi:excisionase family DNA binding protein
MSHDSQAILSVIMQLREEVAELRRLVAPASEYGGIELACQMLSLSAYTIREKCRQGIIPHHREGRHLLFSRTELLKYRQQSYQPTAQEMAAKAMRGRRKTHR